MFTSERIDFHGVDRGPTSKLRRHLSREAFERSQIFSYRAYRVVSLLARIPDWPRIPAFRWLRRNANTVMMYMMQAHMLHDMYVAHPRWAEPAPQA
jgi:hypothetical protein